MSRTRIVGGRMSIITQQDHYIYATKGNIVNNAVTQVVQTGDKDGVSYGSYQELIQEDISVDGPGLILHSKRLKGRNAKNTGTAEDLLCGDYPDNRLGFEKLQNQLYLEELKNNKDQKFILSSREKSAMNAAELKVEKLKYYSDYSNSELFEIFKSKINNFATGELDALTQVFVNKMQSNSGGTLMDPKLTEAVEAHGSFINFSRGTENSLNQFLSKGGKVEDLSTTLSEEAQDNELYKLLLTNGVDSTKFNRKIDNFLGLRILINDVWAYELYCLNYSMKKNRLKANLKYSLYDHFGLDYPDIHKYDKEIFYVWFYLQHFRGYQPFITKIDIYREFKTFLPL